MEAVVDRIRSIIGEHGSPSERDFAQKIGVSPSTLSGVLNGKRQSLDKIVEIARATKTNLNWLATGEGPRELGALAEGAATEFLSAPRYDAAASWGDGAFIDEVPVLDRIPFTKEFMQKKLGRANTNGLILLDARGDSMEPTIYDGALMMIDTSPASLTSAIYAFTYDGALFVKRLNHLPDAVEAVSDNRDYSPFIINKEQMENFRVIGRVVWVGHMI